MQILMLGNSFTATNHLPDLLAQRTGAQVTAHTRGGARLAEQLNPATKLGSRTRAALDARCWDYVILQEMSHGPISAPEKYRDSVARLCGEIRAAGAVPVIYGTWAYRADCPRLAALGLTEETMFHGMQDACRGVATANNALFADVGGAFFACPDRANLYAADGIHPNLRGAMLAADTLAQVIRTHAAR